MDFLKLNKLMTRTYREDEGDPVPVCPVSINPTTVRCVTPRRENRPGARLTFNDGGGFAVRESYDDVMNYIEHGTLPPAYEPPAPQITDAASGNA